MKRGVIMYGIGAQFYLGREFIKPPDCDMMALLRIGRLPERSFI